MAAPVPPSIWADPALEPTLRGAVPLSLRPPLGPELHFAFVLELEHHVLLVGQTRTPLHTRDPTALGWSANLPLTRRLPALRLVAWAAVPGPDAARALQYGWWRALRRQGYTATRGHRPSPAQVLRPLPHREADADALADSVQAVQDLWDAPLDPAEHLAEALTWLLLHSDGRGRGLRPSWQAPVQHLVDAWPEWTRHDTRFAWRVADHHRPELRRHPSGDLQDLPALPQAKPRLHLEMLPDGRARITGDPRTPVLARLHSAAAVEWEPGEPHRFLHLDRLPREHAIALLREDDVAIPEPLLVRLWQRTGALPETP